MQASLSGREQLNVRTQKRTRPLKIRMSASPRPRPLPIPQPRARAVGGVPAFSPPPGLELEIRMRVAREKLAYDISLKLTEPAVPPELLDEARPFLHASHYDDVLEERSNDALCAFPCCSVRLPSFKPHQQFTLSRLGGAGRVLSTASAYRFCSTECARRSAQYARSLPLEPVAQRDTVGVCLLYTSPSPRD